MQMSHCADLHLTGKRQSAITLREKTRQPQILPKERPGLRRLKRNPFALFKEQWDRAAPARVRVRRGQGCRAVIRGEAELRCCAQSSRKDKQAHGAAGGGRGPYGRGWVRPRGKRTGRDPGPRRGRLRGARHTPGGCDPGEGSSLSIRRRNHPERHGALSSVGGPGGVCCLFCPFVFPKLSMCLLSW